MKKKSYLKLKFPKFICFLALMASDIAALFVSFLFAYFFRSQVLPLVIHFKQSPLSFASQIKNGFLLGVPIVILIFGFEKLYTKRLAFWDEIRHLIKGIVISFLLIIIVVFLSRTYTYFSRLVIIISGFLSLWIFPLFRILMKKFLVKVKLWKKKILIIGTNKTAVLAAQGIRENPILGYDILGFVGEDSETLGQVMFENLQVLGGIDQLEELIKTLGIQDVVIALSHLNQHKMMRLTEICEKTVETTRIVPPIGAFFTMGVEIEILGNVLSLSVERNLIKPWNILLKRLLDFGMAFFLSILFLPIALALAVAIKIDSLGGVIFSQERLGRGSRVFKAFKFRSMYTDGDAKLHDYLKQNPHLRDEWQTYQKLKTYDPRVTKIGKLIRKYSVDEIPQILNVLKGEMSIVGPRPYLPRERDKIGKSSTIISRVRPGMTGLWQVSGRNLLSFKDRLLLDEYYIRNWSFWLDVVILLKTVKVLAKREGAY